MHTRSLSRFDQMPLVGAVMTPFPYFVGPDDSIDAVEALMERHDIHHVPVQADGEVVGVISERELARRGRARRVSQITLGDPLVVGIGTSLAEVMRQMSERRIDSALVLRHGKLAGILSVTDACRLLAELLEDRFPGGSGSAA